MLYLIGGGSEGFRDCTIAASHIASTFGQNKSSSVAIFVLRHLRLTDCA